MTGIIYMGRHYMDENVFIEWRNLDGMVYMEWRDGGVIEYGMILKYWIGTMGCGIIKLIMEQRDGGIWDMQS